MCGNSFISHPFPLPFSDSGEDARSTLPDLQLCPGPLTRSNTALYCPALYCTALYCTVLSCTVLQCTVLHCTALHCTVLNYPVMHSTTLYFTASSPSILIPLQGPSVPASWWTPASSCLVTSFNSSSWQLPDSCLVTSFYSCSWQAKTWAPPASVKLHHCDFDPV